MSRVDYDRNINDIRSKLIITPDDLKASSLLDFNIDDEKILPYILEAQRLFLEPMIGTPFYTKLLDVDGRGYVYDYLVTNYVTPCLIAWSLGTYIKKSPYQIAEGGTFKHYSSDSELPAPNEVRTIAKEEFYKAQDYAWRMAQFIETYKTEYPEWDAIAYEGIKARKSVFHLGGWVMDNGCGVGSSYNRVFMDRNFHPGSVTGERWGSFCGGLTKNPDFFVANFYWGYNNETAMGFDPTTLDNVLTKIPNDVQLLPQNQYVWMVSDTDFIISQGDNPIPLGTFPSVPSTDETYIKGFSNNMYWIRSNIADTYESYTTFQINI